jgi:hypothetical protein
MDALLHGSTTQPRVTGTRVASPRATAPRARRGLVAVALGIALASTAASTSVHAFALDQPIPSDDASTRKGAAAQEPCPCEENKEEPPAKPIANSPREKTTEASNITLAQWVSDWMKNPRRVTAKLAIHGVVPEIELEAVLPASQIKSSAPQCPTDPAVSSDPAISTTGEIYLDPDEASAGNPNPEQIRVAPVAPPIPTNFPFAMQNADPLGPKHLHPDQLDPNQLHPDYVLQEYPIDEYPSEPYPSLELPHPNLFGSLSDVQVTLPASTLVAYIVAHAQNSVRLEMSQQLAAERAMYAQRYELLLQHNQQLQTQLAMIEAQPESTEALALRASMPSKSDWSAPPIESNEQKRCLSLTASREDFDAIQEDLSNIRKQIAILKSNSNPIPFAPSYVGTEEPNAPTRQPQSRQPQALQPQALKPQAWRTARSVPYTPVFSGQASPGQASPGPASNR